MNNDMENGNMNCKSLSLGVASLALGLLAVAPTASAEGFAIGAKAGTPGIGVEGTFGISSALNLRGGFYAFDYSDTLDENGIEYDGDLELENLGAFLDWHPFSGTFRVSVGGVQSGNAFKGTADGALDVGDGTYEAELLAKADWDGFAPYLGIGWGDAVREAGWSLSFDLGVMFTGEPTVSLTGTVSDPALQEQFEQDLAREEADLQDELDDVTIYPVIALGVAYRF
jgi:hypothetical protein